MAHEMAKGIFSNADGSMKSGSVEVDPKNSGNPLFNPINQKRRLEYTSSKQGQKGIWTTVTIEAKKKFSESVNESCQKEIKDLATEVRKLSTKSEKQCPKFKHSHYLKALTEYEKTAETLEPRNS